MRFFQLPVTADAVTAMYSGCKSARQGDVLREQALAQAFRNAGPVLERFTGAVLEEVGYLPQHGKSSDAGALSHALYLLAD